MKTHLCLSPVGFFTVLILLLPASAAPGAAETGSPWYFRPGVGVEYSRASGLTLDFTQPARKVDFNPGWRVNATGGYRFRSDVAVELEAALHKSEIFSPNSDYALTQFSLIASVRLQPDRPGKLTPYLSIGAGAVAAWLDIGHATLQGSSLRGNECAAAFAGQIQAGLDYRIGSRVRLGCAYQGLWTSSPEWDLPSYDPSKAFGVIKLQCPAHHSVVISATFEF
ncbi:MAG: outer membrane beta-barrel protein [Verrucomicrobiota bacterium]